MKIKTIKDKGMNIAAINSSEILITDVQSALDILATVSYETGSDSIIIDKSAISEEFFDLKTKLAGEILQKFINYKMKLAIIGDFSIYSSKSLADFIYESNKGRHIFFLPNIELAVEKLVSIGK